MSDIAIRADGISKLYRIGELQRYKALRDTMTNALYSPFRAAALLFNRQASKDGGKTSNGFIWALKDISFEIKHGEVVGIIGRNGAGKSTLLKILSRITEPTSGYADVHGRVGSLIEVGTGFHPELTGRENIYLNGAIMGMKKAEIDRKFDEIVAFAELEKFLDTPVKLYSSGMYMRLAFSVAAHLEPEILLVDEVLAVGDAAFQRKCLGKMGDVAKQGRTVLFVSHNMGAIQSLTENCIWLKNGRVEAYNQTREIVEQYFAETLDHLKSEPNDLAFYRRNPSTRPPVCLTRVSVNGSSVGSPTIEMGSNFTVFIEMEATREISGAHTTVVIKDFQGRSVAVLFSWDHNFSLFLRPGRQVIEVRVDELPLAPGQYFADIGVNQSTDTTAYDVIKDFPLFKVVNNGQVLYWLNRPWGSVHWDKVTWKL